ncbi:hypothetical protein SOASR029_27520 [Budvicia aquatica]|nr:hypothetical protein SOASR029_27520 [Budvicia aquatica]
MELLTDLQSFLITGMNLESLFNMKLINFKLSGIALAIASMLIPAISYADIAATGDVIPGIPTTPNWNVPGELVVGNTTDGTLTVSNGGVLTSGDAASLSSYIGKLAGSTGQVEVTGAGSRWTNDAVLMVGYQGDGTLRILDGGVVETLTSVIHVGFDDGSKGYLEVSGAGSKLNSGHLLYIGGENNSDGRLIIADGGALTSVYDSYIANHSGSIGRVEVTGKDSVWSSGLNMFIGNSGNGSLKITEGGLVVTQLNGIIGTESTGAGYVEVSGTDSRWQVGSILNIGNLGSATMIISDGGVVSSQQGYISSALGMVEVTGIGSRWDNADHLSVGYAANSDSTLNILNGGVVSSGFSYVGNQPSSKGQVNISGSGSSWQNSSLIVAGFSGAGKITVSDGASLSSAGGYIGLLPSAKGEILITGTGSNWVNSGDLGIGQAGGNGSLTISNNGIVQTGNVAVAVDASSVSTLNIGSAAGELATAAGYLDAPLITLGSGDGHVVFNHTNNNYQFNPIIAGTGSVDVYSGTTILNGINTYAGTTTITAGTLQAGAPGAFSAASDYVVSTAGRLDLAGYDQSVTSLSNAGIVDFNGTPGTTLTVTGDYIGNNGLLSFKTMLNGDGSDSDKLVVDGNTSGTTRVRVTNAGGSGAATLNGIELIQVDGRSDGEFVKDGRIVAGAYDYSLARGEGANASNWYLVSAILPEPPTPPVPPTDPQSSMVVRPEAGGYATNLAAANQMFILRLDDRLDQTQYVDALTGEHKQTSLWLRNSGGHNRSRDSSGQLHTQANRYVVQLGGNIAQWSHNGQDRFQLGAMVGYANSKGNTTSRLSEYRIRSSVNGYSAGVYGTWYSNDTDKTGLYVDSWLQYSWFNNQINGQELSSEKYKSKGVSASLESGYTFKIGEDTTKNTGYFIQPKAQAVWMNVQADDHREANGTYVSGEGDGNIQTRLGVKAFANIHNDKRALLVVKPFAEINWIHNCKDFGARLNTVSIKQEGAANIGELKLGMEGQIEQHVDVWGSVSQQIGDQGYSDTAVMLGVKYRF